jgi:DNA invertase Pin-like site-specific DNA recombinase
LPKFQQVAQERLVFVFIQLSNRVRFVLTEFSFPCQVPRMENTSEMRRAFGYVRVSSVGQSGEERDGIPRQKAAIRKHAAASGIRIVHWFEDRVSGKKDLENRPALQEMMTALHGNGTKLVLIEKLDRLARDLMIQESIIADFKRNGFELVSVAEPDMCSDDPTRKLLRQMLGAFAEYECTMISLKLRGARLRAAAKRGASYVEGRVPFGYRAVKHDGIPVRVPEPSEQATIARTKHLRDAGYSLAKIAEKLTAEGRKARVGAKWYAKQVARVLTRAAIAG